MVVTEVKGSRCRLQASSGPAGAASVLRRQKAPSLPNLAPNPVRSYFPLLKQGREVEAEEGELEAFINSINIYQALWQATNLYYGCHFHRLNDVGSHLIPTSVR